ncbi:MULTISPECIES: MerR family transcriptional regulator [Dyella]|uniref:MerR family transcriptional regulator n=2 Tax=Dyella TaxID=231454 RepID=A0A4R0YJ92_9GAMM|nr:MULTISPECIES: MerR family transcriptional regulator [Dyella]TBR36166.1 MerR family transcriptional regulator [Dyella terrae]TCI06215.1 MerR family transcriptional regulator [Dyella soli]
MRLTVGELARRTGLTVRTLHHYDHVGLLHPSARSDAGYRLYTPDDVERLYRIVALRRLGLPLSDIGTALAGPEVSLATLLDRQIDALEQNMARDRRLHDQLRTLRDSLAAGQSPDPARWLDTLELMSMYEKYFSAEELKALPLYSEPDAQVEWSALVTAIQAAMDRGSRPGDPDADILALRWMTTVGKSTGNNPAFLMRLHEMNENEPDARQKTGITEAMQAFVEQSLIAARLAIFERYLPPEDMARMREHYGRDMYAWPPLIAALLKARDAGMPPDDPEVRTLAKRWIEMFTAYAGTDPANHARIREAYAKEPDLRSGSAVDETLIVYVRAALEGMR